MCTRCFTRVHDKVTALVMGRNAGGGGGGGGSEKSLFVVHHYPARTIRFEIT